MYVRIQSMEFVTKKKPIIKMDFRTRGEVYYLELPVFYQFTLQFINLNKAYFFSNGIDEGFFF